MSDPMASSLARLLAEAAADLESASRGIPVCAPTKAGRSAPGTKYYEGRWAALNEVARRCRRSREDVVPSATVVRRSWSDALTRLRQRDAGQDWMAYRQGGSDALDGLLGVDAGTGSEYTPGGMLLESPRDPV